MSDLELPLDGNSAPVEQPAVPLNPLVSALLSSQGSSGTLDPVSLLLSQLGGQAASDPRAALLMRLLDRRGGSPENIDEAKEDPDAQVAEHAAQHAQVGQQGARGIRELRTLAKRMYTELESLRERNDALAAALGACHLCFGTDPLCEECGGRGAPGSLAPDPDAFHDYIVPALRRVQTIRRERERRRSRYLDPGLEVAGGAPQELPAGRPATTEGGGRTS